MLDVLNLIADAVKAVAPSLLLAFAFIGAVACMIYEKRGKE